MAFARAAELRMSNFDAQGLANTAWAFAKVDQADALLFIVMAQDPAKRVSTDSCHYVGNLPSNGQQKPQFPQALRSWRPGVHPSESADARAGCKVLDCPPVQPWTQPQQRSTKATIVIWHHGTYGEHGVSGAATISLITDSKATSQDLFSGYIYIPGSFTTSCAEYLGLLLGLRQVAANVQCLTVKKICVIGSAESDNRHQEFFAPSEESMVPLANAAKDLLKNLAKDCTNAPATNMHLVAKSDLQTENEMATFSLEHRLSSVQDDSLTKLMQEASSVWSFKSERSMTREHFRRSLCSESLHAIHFQAASSTAETSASVKTSGRRSVQVYLRKGDYTKIIFAPVDVTAGQISRKYGEPSPDSERRASSKWEVHSCSAGARLALFPDVRLRDLNTKEPIHLELVQDTSSIACFKPSK